MCYAKELKEGFVEYTEQVVKLMVPLLKFYFHDDILLKMFYFYNLGWSSTFQLNYISMAFINKSKSDIWVRV